MTDYFCGQFLSKLECRCGYNSKSFNNFFDISVSFSGESRYGSESIIGMVKEFLRSEEIQEGYCGKEKKLKNMQKQMYSRCYLKESL